MPVRLSVAVTAVLALAASAGCQPSRELRLDAPRGTPADVKISASPVPLYPEHPSEIRVGNFTFAGALVLTAENSDRLHGLSDIEVDADGRLMAVSDLGSLWRGRLVLDAAGRLAGVDDSSLEPLTNSDGRPLVEKMESDGEGLAVLRDGTFLVSFEDRHRIWRYTRDIGRPTPAPWPDVEMEDNGGMEALATDPAGGDDAYLVGIETSGRVFSCRLAGGCRPLTTFDKPAEFGLVALRRLSGDRTIVMLRAFDPTRGNRIILEIFRGSTLVDRLDMARPMTIDNFEGVAAVERPRGRLRFYLLSDDNGSRQQRTILMAFDWEPRP